MRGESNLLALTMEGSHETIREWVQRLSSLSDRFWTYGSEVGSVLIDGAMMRIGWHEARAQIAVKTARRRPTDSIVRYTHKMTDPHLHQGATLQMGREARPDGRVLAVP